MLNGKGNGKELTVAYQILVKNTETGATFPIEDIPKQNDAAIKQIADALTEQLKALMIQMVEAL